MFIQLPSAPPAIDTLWNTPLNDRIATLFERPRRIAWLYENPDTSTFRYRAFNMVSTLQADTERRASATWFSASELPLISSFINKIDTIVVTRFRYSAILHQTIAKARRYGVRVLFDSDDLVFDVDYAHVVMDSLAQPSDQNSVWDHWFAYIGRLNATARLCEGGITTNPYLADRMAKVLGGKPTAVVPNFLNRLQQEFSASLLEAKRVSGWQRRGPVTIGYFSGSPTHNKDFAIAAPALARLLEADPDVTIRVVGFLDETGPLGRFKDRVEISPLMDYISLQRAIAEVEVNIAPLRDNTFTNCKSELKFFEAAVVGTWTVATPTSTYRAAINDGVTGRLARTHEWDMALAEAVSMARNTEAYAERAESAAQYAYEAYGWNRLTSIILDAVTTPSSTHFS